MLSGCRVVEHGSIAAGEVVVGVAVAVAVESGAVMRRARAARYLQRQLELLAIHRHRETIS